MERTNQIFQYNGSPITFSNGDSVVVNATEMAKPFGKSTTHWLRNQSTQEFIKELSRLRNRNVNDLVQVVNGGSNGEHGTWLHEDVAMEFARWLSPAFAIWCNDRIKELLTTGVTTTRNDDEAIAYAMMVLQKRLDESKAEKERLAYANEKQSEQLKLQAPKVAYHDEVLTSTSTYTTTQIAKEFGMSAEALNRKLHEIGVQFKQSGQWLLYTQYADKGYTKTITRSFDGGHGVHTSQLTVWTERGRKFIHALNDTNWDKRRAWHLLKNGKEVTL